MIKTITPEVMKYHKNTVSVFKEGERLSRLPTQTLSITEMMKAYAYVIHTQGEGMKSRQIMDAAIDLVEEMEVEMGRRSLNRCRSIRDTVSQEYYID